jgi:hypothetical protein
VWLLQGSGGACSFKAALVRAPQAAVAWTPSRRRQRGLLKQQWRELLQGSVGVGSLSSGDVGSSSSDGTGYKAQGLDLSPTSLDLGSFIFLFLKISFSCRLL